MAEPTLHSERYYPTGPMAYMQVWEKETDNTTQLVRYEARALGRADMRLRAVTFVLTQVMLTSFRGRDLPTRHAEDQMHLYFNMPGVTRG